MGAPYYTYDPTRKYLSHKCKIKADWIYSKLAASADHHDISNFLIQEGADCNAVDRYGRLA